MSFIHTVCCAAYNRYSMVEMASPPNLNYSTMLIYPYQEYSIWGGPIINPQTIFEDKPEPESTLPFTYHHEAKRKRPQRKKLVLEGSPFHHGCICGHGDILRSRSTYAATTAQESSSKTEKWVPRQPAIRIGYTKCKV